MLILEDLSFHQGWEAGNYANAYSSEDLDNAWESLEDEESMELMEDSSYREGFILGFFSSYENDEISSDHLDEYLFAENKWLKVLND